MRRTSVVQYPDKGLLTVATPVTAQEWLDIPELALLMRTAMTANNGVDIAANQIGSPLAVCIVKDVTMVNPRVIYHDAEVKVELEGCLSVKHGHMQFPRPASVSVAIEFHNIRGKRIVKEFYGMMARIVQHEIRHLNGRLVNEGFTKK